VLVGTTKWPPPRHPAPHLDNDRNHQSLALQPFEPKTEYRPTKFEPLPTIINPNYRNLCTMFSSLTDVPPNSDHQAGSLNQNYTFYAPPRFVSKIL
jgi:hypothetical protein